MTNNETYFIKTGLKEPPPIGSAPLVINGSTYEFEGQDIGGTALTLEDEDVLTPLLAANSRSRSEMVEQAKETAKQIFDIDVGKSMPPSWWMNDEHLESLTSRDVLVYLPFKHQESKKDIPNVFKEIYKSSRDRSGWFIIQIQKQNGPWLLVGSVGRLTN